MAGATLMERNVVPEVGCFFLLIFFFSTLGSSDFGLMDGLLMSLQGETKKNL